MINWYEMPGALEDCENNPAYHEKLAVDADAEPNKSVKAASKRAVNRADCSMKDNYNYYARDNSWKYHRDHHYDHRYCDMRYILIKGTDGFCKQDKVYYRRLFRRTLSKSNLEMPTKGCFYKKTMWWDRFWY